MKRGLISLFLFTIAAVLGRYQEVQGTVPLFELFAMAGASSATAALIYLGFKTLLKNENKALILCFLTLFFFFFFGEIQHFADAQLGNLFRRRWIALAVAGFFGLAGMLVMFSRREFKKIGDFTHLIARVMGVAAVVFFVFSRGSGPDLKPRQAKILLDQKLTATNRPNIYFLLFDSYTSPASLEKYFGHNDTEFLTYLETNNFQILTNGKANYFSTPFCLSTVFNMDYVTVNPRQNTHPAIVNFLWKDIQNSEAPQIFKGLGYEIINLSFFPLLDQMEVYKCPEVRFMGLGDLILRKSPIGYYFEGKERWSLGEVNLELVQKFKESTRPGDKPQFVYAHFMMPHQPFIFASDGSRLPLGLEQSTRKKEFYVEQVGFVNKKIVEMVSEILKNSKEPPIIILQGDHGYRFLEGTNQVAEAGSAFHAYYLPGGKNVPQTLTGVNTFRFILKEYFSASIELAPDQLFASPLDFE